MNGTKCKEWFKSHMNIKDIKCIKCKTISHILPLMLNKIIMKLVMSNFISNLLVSLKKRLDPVWVPARFHMATNIVRNNSKCKSLWSSIIMFNRITYAVMIFERDLLSQKRAGSQTMETRACNKPKFLSVCFRSVYFLSCGNFFTLRMLDGIYKYCPRRVYAR